MKGIIVLMALLMAGCSGKQTQTEVAKNTIQIGDYAFDFPQGFKLVKGHGVDSYVGLIEGDSMRFRFDFGYYSNNLATTPEEYIAKGQWRFVIPQKLISHIPKHINQPPKLAVMETRPATANDSLIGKGCDYVAHCTFYGDTQWVAINLPQQIKNTRFKIDSIGTVYRKIATAIDPKNGETGVYLQDLAQHDSTMSSNLALSITTRDISPQQQQLALSIFETGRLIKPKKQP